MMNAPVLLDKVQYKGYSVLHEYVTESYFRIAGNQDGTVFSLEREAMSGPVRKQFEMTLYQDYVPNARAYGIFEEGILVAFIELDHETWNNRLRVTELYVIEALRRKGLGTKLIAFGIAEAKRLNARMLILETQTLNAAAVSFYLKTGFFLCGFDLYAYSDKDPSNHEVRLEMGMMIR